MVEPFWCQFEVLIPPEVSIPPVEEHHPLDCHQLWSGDRVVCGKIVQVLDPEDASGKIGDTGCSATFDPAAAR